MVKENKNLIVGLDIGTSKIVAIVAEVSPEGGLNIIGLGTQPSRGLKKGVVVNIEATMASIQRVLEEAELMADCRITEVYTGIAGSHIRSLNSSGMVAIKEKEVTQADIDRVVETAKAIAIPNDQQILHILPQEFIIDGQEDVREPLGMSGVRLEVKVHIVTGAVSAVENITKCVRRCGLEVKDIILQPLASAIAVLNDDEKELGVCLIDIGGGTTDVAVFAGGAIRHTAVIPIAGDQVTNDIAMTLRTPTKEAEELKVRHGCALRQLADPKDVVEVPGVGDRPPRKLSRQTLAEVVEPRIEELYTLVQGELRRSGFEEMLSSGIVLTGGTALLAGHDRAGRGGLPPAGARGRAGVRRRAGRRRPQPAVRDGRRAAARRPRPVPAGAGLARADRRHHRRRGTDEAVVQGEFLRDTRERRERTGSGAIQSIAARQPSGQEKGDTMFEIIDQTSQEGAVIKVIGVGGCGGNAVEHMIGRGLAGVEFICANTDAQALKRSTANLQLQLGSNLTRGLGAGAKPEIGRDAANEDRDRIAEMIEGADMLFITAGMGGGTGTGAAPVIADIAKTMNILTVAVVTRPFAFEGKRQRVAQTGIEELSKKVDSLIIIPNDKLMEVLGEDVSLLDAYAAANDVLHSAVSGHRRGDQQRRPRQRRLRRRADGDGRGRDGDDGLGDGGRRGARADRGAGGGQEPAARGRQPARRARRAGQHHRVGGAEDARVPRGDEHDQGIHRRGRDGHRRHRDRRRDGGPAAGDDGGDRPGRRGRGQGRARRTSRWSTRRSCATGTDNVGMTVETINYDDLDAPAVVRRGRAGASAVAVGRRPSTRPRSRRSCASRRTEGRGRAPRRGPARAQARPGRAAMWYDSRL